MKKIYICLTLSLTLIFGGCDFLLYMPPIQQGNVLTRAQIDQIKPGMTNTAVIKTLGSPVLINTFNNNMMEYVYSYKVRGCDLERKQFIIHFSGGRVSQIDNRYY
jgi:outer membrane protein assembly factor BamE